MSSATNVKENLETQIFELEALQSVFPKELKIADHGVLADINDFITGNTTQLPQRLEYDLKIESSKGVLEVLISLPLGYPHDRPEVYCRCSGIDRNGQMELNNALVNFSKLQEIGEPIIYSIILWIQEFVENSSSLDSKDQIKSNEESGTDQQKEFGRYWIYSHHIYSKIKRKDIVDLAKDCCLNGFSFVGKPGIICIEGMLDNCEFYWHQIKRMNWHRILIKFIEKDFDCSNGTDKHRKFSTFQELCFPNSEGHNDMSKLAKYLTNHELEHAFKELFGLEPKSDC